jgi:hypothetical protein
MVAVAARFFQVTGVGTVIRSVLPQLWVLAGLLPLLLLRSWVLLAHGRRKVR